MVSATVSAVHEGPFIFWVASFASSKGDPSTAFQAKSHGSEMSAPYPGTSDPRTQVMREKASLQAGPTSSPSTPNRMDFDDVAVQVVEVVHVAASPASLERIPNGDAAFDDLPVLQIF